MSRQISGKDRAFGYDKGTFAYLCFSKSALKGFTLIGHRCTRTPVARTAARARGRTCRHAFNERSLTSRHWSIEGTRLSQSLELPRTVLITLAKSY